MGVTGNWSKLGLVLELARDGCYFDGRDIKCFDCKSELPTSFKLEEFFMDHEPSCQRIYRDIPFGEGLLPQIDLILTTPFVDIHGPDEQMDLFTSGEFVDIHGRN